MIVLASTVVIGGFCAAVIVPLGIGTANAINEGTIIIQFLLSYLFDFFKAEISTTLNTTATTTTPITTTTSVTTTTTFTTSTTTQTMTTTSTPSMLNYSSKKYLNIKIK